MTVDPLSSSTRTTKRNLLVASVVAISYTAFDVKVSKIPVGGLSIEFDQRVFTFLLLMVLLYFFATFALYYFIDIRNVEKTSHETKAEKLFDDRDFFYVYETRRVQRRINRALPPDVAFEQSENLSRKFQEMQSPYYNPANFSHDLSVVTEGSLLVHPKSTTRNSAEAFLRTKNAAAYAIFDGMITNALRQFPKRFRRRNRRLWVYLQSVRAIYFIRNYLTDGILPFALGVAAFLALFHVIDLHWLRRISP